MQPGIIYKSKDLYKFSIAALILIAPILIFDSYILFLIIEPYLDIPYSGHSFHWENFQGFALSGIWEFIVAVLLALTFFLILLSPIFILNSYLEITFSSHELIINRPFVFRTKSYSINDFKGYSISSTLGGGGVVGLLKFYHTEQNFMLSSIRFDNIENIVEQLEYSGVKFLGHEDRAFNWSLKKWGQYKYLYDVEGYEYLRGDEGSLNELVANRPDTSYFAFAGVVICFYGIFLSFPFFDLRDRYVEYHLHQYPREAVAQFYRCIPTINRFGRPTGKMKAYYEFYVGEERYTDTKNFKNGCPPKNSKALILYSYKNPDISKFIRPLMKKKTKKPSQN